jgi:DNA adenine methylase
VKPPVSYFGSKATVAERIVALLPEHEHYIEPFCGSLAVLLAKPPSRMETVNDADSRLMTFWRVLRDRPEDLQRVCWLTPHSRAENEMSKDLAADDDVELARLVWVRLTQGRGGQMLRTGWRFYQDPRGSHSSMPDYLDAYLGRMAPAAARLRGVTLECGDALRIIERYGEHPRNLLYVDPPYLGSLRTEDHRGFRRGSRYAHELLSDDDHRGLAKALDGCRAAVVLSGYDSPLYGELFGGWYRAEIATQTGNGGSDRARTEVLWSNRQFPQGTLFDLEREAAV